jgi:ABC-2 type transport system permease protein
MLNVVRSELVRLRRPRLLLAWFALMAVIAVLINTVMFGTVGNGKSMPAGAPGVVFPDAAALSGPYGLVAGLRACSHHGSRDDGRRRCQHRRGAAHSKGSWDLHRELGHGSPLPSHRCVGERVRGAVRWGGLGLVLAVLARSSAIAISVGVGYVLVVESIVTMAATGSSHWLLGSTLSALANGGESSLSYGASGGLGLLYVIGLLLATVAFTRRDVTTRRRPVVTADLEDMW